MHYYHMTELAMQNIDAPAFEEQGSAFRSLRSGIKGLLLGIFSFVLVIIFWAVTSVGFLGFWILGTKLASSPTATQAVTSKVSSVLAGGSADAAQIHAPTVEIGTALDVARSYWGTSPANCSSYRITVVSHLSGPAIGEATQPTNFSVPCSMEVLSGLQPLKLCQVVVHEFGHWLGLGHSDDRLNVMFPTSLPENIPDLCKQTYPGEVIS
jgi:hypothetical protein